MSSPRKLCLFCGTIGQVIKWGQGKQKRTRYRCKACRKTFCARTKTVRYKTRINEKQWQSLPKILSLRTHPSGSDLGRLLEKSASTGQRIMRKVRQSFPRSFDGPPLTGCAELDETTFRGQWIGGAKRRHGGLKLIKLQNRGTKSMNNFVDTLVSPAATVLTDEWGGYIEVGLKRDHYTVCHAKEFVSEHCKDVHTNGIEGVWGHAKPLATHVYRGYPNLDEFLREVCFKFNFSYIERRKYLTSHFFRQH